MHNAMSRYLNPGWEVFKFRVMDYQFVSVIFDIAGMAYKVNDDFYKEVQK